MNVRDRQGVVHLVFNYPERWDQGAARDKFGFTRCGEWYRWSGQSVGILTEFHGSPTVEGPTCIECVGGMEPDEAISYHSAVNASKV